jgi:hypothetical protein
MYWYFMNNNILLNNQGKEVWTLLKLQRDN